MYIRKPAVAGQFYPARRNKLLEAISKMIIPVENKLQVKGVVSPHAGYIYSGQVAGRVFSNIKIPETVVILGPNHNGIGKPYAVMPRGKWLMPMGEVEIAEDLAGSILKNAKILQEDINAHIYEHSLEVQVPFLQYFQPKLRIVPIAIGGGKVTEFNETADALSKCIKEYDKDVLIVASSDMTHYERQESAERKDGLVIDAILKLAEEKMLRRIKKYSVSMCGYAPVSIMLTAVKSLGAKQAKLLKYMTSGDTTGDYNAVVGYAGIAVW